jgi:hypothetical protein
VNTNTLWNPDTEGVFMGLDAEKYHAAPGLSHSTLKHMDPTPAHCLAYMTEKRETTPAQMLGTLAHSKILEPDKALPNLTIKPDNMKFSTKEGKGWREQQETTGLSIITAAESRALDGMTRSIAEHEYAARILARGVSELSLFSCPIWNARLLRKCRIDFVPHGNFLADVKTCEDASPEAFSKSIYNFGYFTQAAWYLDIWNDLVPDEPKETFLFIAVEKSPPYAVAVYALDDAAIEAGRDINRSRAMRWFNCHTEGIWPGYSQEYSPISLPKWAKTDALAA